MPIKCARMRHQRAVILHTVPAFLTEHFTLPPHAFFRLSGHLRIRFSAVVRLPDYEHVADVFILLGLCILR